MVSFTRKKQPGGIDTMKNNITELVFILDRSGSMSGLERDTVGGFNSMIEKQKRTEGRVWVSTVLFDTTTTVIHDRVDIASVRPMTLNDYCPGGCTALMDAVGGAVKHISDIHKYARPEDVPEHTLFVITTDGMENASRTYSLDRVKRMIEEKKSEYGWEFLFLGANIDAAATASRFGIAPDRAVNYHADSEGVRNNFETLCDTVSEIRACGNIGAHWQEKIEKDFKGRKANR